MIWFVVCVPGAKAAAQTVDVDLPDAPSEVRSERDSSSVRNAAGEVTWKSLPRDFVQDQKRIWLFPTQLAKGHGWAPTLFVAGGTIALFYADPAVMGYFRKQNLEDLKDAFGPYVTTGEIASLPVGLLMAGYVRHDPYQTSTALMAAEAYANSAVVDLAMKAITRRQRPSDIGLDSPLRHTFFHSGKSPLKGSSFPSGHSAGAFSVATVVATRYRNHRWVPWVAYGMATAISFSRIIDNAHFPSDVFLGASVGYSVAHFQVLRRH